MQHQETIEGFSHIDLEQCLQSEQQLLLSDLADTLEYVILKTPGDIIISGIKKVIPFKEYLFFISKGVVYQFYKDGQFIRQIGSIGQGPGEYVSAGDICIDEHNNEIIVSGESKLLFYSMEGVFLRYGIQRVQTMRLALSDSIVWSANYPGFWEKFQAIAYTPNGDTASYIRNDGFGTIKIKGVYMVVSKSHNAFYSYNGCTFYKGFETNDTVWQLSGSVAKPHAYIQMGRYKLPYEYSPGTPEYMQLGQNYLGIPAIFEDDNYFVFIAQSRRDVGEKNKYLAYDKKNKSGFIIKNEKGTGIPDDILGGPPIEFRWISDDYFISVCEAYELEETVKSGKFSPVPAFQKQLLTLNEDTNELIVLCHKAQQ